MPTIFEYLGIIIKFYSDEHEPVHIHAYYNEAEIKVSFFIRDGKIYKTTFVAKHGNFPAHKLKQLKKFISVYKEEIVQIWTDFFIWKKEIEIVRITKKL